MNFIFRQKSQLHLFYLKDILKVVSQIDYTATRISKKNYKKNLSICKWKSKIYQYLGEFKSFDNRTFYYFFSNNFYSNRTLI